MAAGGPELTAPAKIFAASVPHPGFAVCIFAGMTARQSQWNAKQARKRSQRHELESRDARAKQHDPQAHARALIVKQLLGAQYNLQLKFVRPVRAAASNGVLPSAWNSHWDVRSAHVTIGHRPSRATCGASVY